MDSRPEVVTVTAPWGDPKCYDKMLQMKKAGVTGIQIYTYWRDFEPTGRGEFDWSVLDPQVELIKKSGLKYVPFILIGPKYASPDWWLHDENHIGLKCLEHGKESPIDSIWNKNFWAEIDRVLKAFAAHYMPWDVLESVQPGICGDYGEAIMPVTGNWPGDYHSHPGYWSGDVLAAADFRRWISQKYGSFAALKSAWFSKYGTDLTSFDDVAPFCQNDAPSRTAYFDMLDWYRDSMTAYVDFWMATCRKYFGSLPIYICTGGMEEPTHASLFSDQAKTAAKYGGGIRLTNECNRYFDNFYVTAYTWSACNFYGAYYGLEPVGPATPEGVTTRMFGSAYYANKQIFYYADNIFDMNRDNICNKSTENFVKYLPLLKETKSQYDVAFFWPGYVCAWNKGQMPDNVKSMLTFLRSKTDIMPVNEQMIADGALNNFKLLFIPSGGFTKRETLIAIANWVKSGGKIFSVGRMTDLELKPVAEYDEIFGLLPDSENGTGHCEITINENEYKTFEALQSYHAGSIWMGLTDDTFVLSGTHEEKGTANTTIKKGANVFGRKFAGGGLSIMYLGPVSFKYDPQALFGDRGAFPAILTDVLNLYTNAVNMATEEGEVVRGYIGGKLYALYPDGTIEEK